MGLEIAQRRVRLAVQELNARTVPALLTGLEAGTSADTEQVAFTPLLEGNDLLANSAELHTDEANEFTITTMVDDESTLLFETSIVDSVKPENDAENTQFDAELPIATDGDTFDRPIKPFFRSLSGDGETGEVSEVTEDAQLFEVTSAEIDPSLMYMTGVGIEGGKSEVIEGEREELTSTDEPKLDDVVLWPEEVANGGEVILYTLGGIADSGLAEDFEKPVEITDVPTDELMYYSTVHDCPIIEEVADTTAVLEVADPAADGDEVAQPNVFFKPLNDEPQPTTAIVEDSDDTSLLSALTFDNFTASDSAEDTQELEVTEEIAVEEPVALNDTVATPEATAKEAHTVATDYFSIDGDLLDMYLGIGSKKRK